MNSKFTVDASAEGFDFGVQTAAKLHTFSAKYPTTAEVARLQEGAEKLREDKATEAQELIYTIDALSEAVDKPEEFKELVRSLNMKHQANLVKKILDEFNGEFNGEDDDNGTGQAA